jgi:hypothetical protein
MPDESSEQPAGPSVGDTRAEPTADGTRREPTADGREATAAGSERTAGGRDVVVPLRLYKTVTVFSTLFAIAAILAGFVLLDRGTQRATASPEEVSLPLAALGLVVIAAGSAVYAFSTRFRAEGMGKSKDDTAEGSDDG